MLDVGRMMGIRQREARGDANICTGLWPSLPLHQHATNCGTIDIYTCLFIPVYASSVITHTIGTTPRCPWDSAKKNRVAFRPSLKRWGMHIVEKSMWGVSACCECRIAPQLLWSSWDLMCFNDLQAEYTVCISLPVLRAERHTLPDLCQNCCQAWHSPGLIRL
jgi:hypothetical protein